MTFALAWYLHIFTLYFTSFHIIAKNVVKIGVRHNFLLTIYHKRRSDSYGFDPAESKYEVRIA